jgi:hypothetical protein
MATVAPRPPPAVAKVPPAAKGKAPPPAAKAAASASTSLPPVVEPREVPVATTAMCSNCGDDMVDYLDYGVKLCYTCCGSGWGNTLDDDPVFDVEAVASAERTTRRLAPLTVAGLQCYRHEPEPLWGDICRRSTRLKQAVHLPERNFGNQLYILLDKGQYHHYCTQGCLRQHKNKAKVMLHYHASMATYYKLNLEGNVNSDDYDNVSNYQFYLVCIQLPQAWVDQMMAEELLTYVAYLDYDFVWYSNTSILQDNTVYLPNVSTIASGVYRISLNPRWYYQVTMNYYRNQHVIFPDRATAEERMNRYNSRYLDGPDHLTAPFPDDWSNSMTAFNVQSPQLGSESRSGAASSGSTSLAEVTTVTVTITSDPGDQDSTVTW